MTYKLLYVEDEPFLAQIVSDGLTTSGYDVIRASDGEQGLTLFKKGLPDICVLDIMLPHKDGYALAEEIRLINPTVPIIFLSARTLAEDVVKGFNIGGNDYLKKPFSIDELLVRLQSLLTRFSVISPTTKISNYQFGNCSLDTLNQSLKTSMGTFHLSFKESSLMELLIINQNSILERQIALTKIWGDDNFYNSRSMDVFMAHLRKLLKDEKNMQIISLRSLGYKLIINSDT